MSHDPSLPFTAPPGREHCQVCEVTTKATGQKPDPVWSQPHLPVRGLDRCGKTRSGCISGVRTISPSAPPVPRLVGGLPNKLGDLSTWVERLMSCYHSSLHRCIYPDQFKKSVGIWNQFRTRDNGSGTVKEYFGGVGNVVTALKSLNISSVGFEAYPCSVGDSGLKARI